MTSEVLNPFITNSLQQKKSPPLYSDTTDFTSTYSSISINDSYPINVCNEQKQVENVTSVCECSPKENQSNELKIENEEESELDSFAKIISQKTYSKWYRKIKRVIFNSENPNDHWNIGNSDFEEKIKGSKAICIAIEDDRKHVIAGVYVKREENESILTDEIFGEYKDIMKPEEKERKIKRKEGEIKERETSIGWIHWSLNSYRNVSQFPLKEGYNHFYLGKEQDEILFSFGWEEKEGKRIHHDIVIYKEGVGKPNKCEQYCYNYRDKTYITQKGEELKEGKPVFKRFIVYELGPLEYVKPPLIRMHRKINLDD